MKVLHITPAYYPARGHGGPIVSVHTLNKFLAKAGIDVTVYTTNINGRNGRISVPLEKEVLMDGVRVHYFPISWAGWGYAGQMHRALAENIGKFDLIHITSVFLSVSTLGAYYARKTNVPYVISPRGSLMKEPLAMKNALEKKFYLSLIERRNLKGAAAIHFTTEVEREEYLKAGFPLKSAIVIPNSFDAESLPTPPAPRMFRDKFGIPPEKNIVLFLSRLNWKKGLDTLIPAFARVVREIPQAFLVLVGGDDGYRKEVEVLIDRFDLRACTLFTGMLEGAEKVAAFKESTLFVLPSYSENFGMAVVEAMACGLPVVVSEGVGIAPLIRRAGAGAVTKKNKEEVARAIVRLIRDPAAAREFGERGKRLVREEFSAEKIAAQFLAEYNKLVSLQ